MGHAERAHSILSPSSAHRWMDCTASAKLEEQFPDTSGDAAKEGTLAHELCEAKLTNYFYPAQMSKRKLTSFINKCKKEELWQDEMLEHTDTYIDAIKTVALSFDTAPYVVPEKEYDLTMYIPEEGAHGTADCVMIHGHDLHIFDFKYGKGVPVSPVENPQLMLYALGAYEAYKMLYAITDVHLHIVQPRIDNTAEWSLPIGSLLSFGELVKQKAKIAAEGNGVFSPSEDNCRFCRARAKCRARADKNVELAFFTDKKPELLTDEEIGDYLTKGSDVAKWLKDVQEYALSQCLAGKDIPGWKAVEGRSTRKWSDADAAFDTLINGGIDEAVLYEKTPITLAKLEKLMGKKTFADTVGEYVVKAPGKPTLVPESDKREAITNVVSAAEAFNAKN